MMRQLVAVIASILRRPVRTLHPELLVPVAGLLLDFPGLLGVRRSREFHVMVTPIEGHRLSLVGLRLRATRHRQYGDRQRAKQTQSPTQATRNAIFHVSPRIARNSRV